MHVQIKRYANRKLYNTEASRYITLSDISDLLRDGREVRVVDNATGKDISALVLSRVLADTERKGTPGTPGPPGDRGDTEGPVLGERVQRQLASLFALLRRYADDVQGNLSDVRDNVVRWIHTGPPPDDGEASGRPEPETLEVAVERAIRALDLPTRSDLAQLQSQIEELTTLLHTLKLRA